MAKKQQNEFKAAQARLINAQALSLILKELFPYFKYAGFMLSTYLLGPFGVSATKNILKLLGLY